MKHYKARFLRWDESGKLYCETAYLWAWNESMACDVIRKKWPSAEVVTLILKGKV